MVDPLIKQYVLNSERAIEVPIFLMVLLAHYGERILEVGNTLNMYTDYLKHIVLDKGEKYPGVINEDIEQYIPEKKYDCVISVSTLEHIGHDGADNLDPEKIGRVIRHIKKDVLKKGGELIFSAPVGWNPDFDNLVRDGKFNWIFYYLHTGDVWRVSEKEVVMAQKYNTPHDFGNGLVIASILND